MELSHPICSEIHSCKNATSNTAIKQKQATTVKPFETITRTIVQSPKNKVSTKIHAILECAQ